MREKYESLSLAILKDLAKARGMKGTSALRKAQLIEAMLEQDEKDKAADQVEAAKSMDGGKDHQEAGSSSSETNSTNDRKNRPRRNSVKKRETNRADEKQTIAAHSEPQQDSDGAIATQDKALQGSEETPGMHNEAHQGASEAAVVFNEAYPGSPEAAAVSNEAHQGSEEAPAVSGVLPQNSEDAHMVRHLAQQRDSQEGHPQRAVTGRNAEEMRPQRSGVGRNQAGGTSSREDSQDRSFMSRRRRTPEGSSRTSYDRNSPERRTYAPRMRSSVGEPAENRRGHGMSGSVPEGRGNGTSGNVPEGRSYGTSGSTPEGRSYGTSGNASEGRGYGDVAGGTENHRYGNTAAGTEEHVSGIAANTVPGSSFKTPENDAEARSLTDSENAAETRRVDIQQGRSSESYEAAETRMADADRPPAELSQLDSGQSVSGILEVMPDGYGFIRSDNYLPGENDVYVSPSQIRRFNLKTGDIISGNTRIKSQQEKFSALLYLKKINGLAPSEAMKRYNFEDMTPVFPNERLRMEREQRGIAMRIVDLFSPIGKGQRGMIVSPPKAGKTTLLKDIARSVLKNNPEMRLLILLIDERPEEVTDIKEAICGENVEVIYSTFDETPEHHKRVSEMVIERAKRLVEQKQDVIILLDSITRLARAYNLTVPPSGRTLSGGLDPAALHMPKRFFGAARNMREGGSLTILATALVDTGSKMDDVVYEEFKGTGNMELVLDRKLSERRVFPAIDIPKSGTRREDLLLDREEQEAIYYMRRALNGMKPDDAVESILNTLLHTRDNRDVVTRVRRQKGV